MDMYILYILLYIFVYIYITYYLYTCIYKYMGYIYTVYIYIYYKPVFSLGDGIFFTKMIYPKISWVLIQTSWTLNFHRQNSQLKKNAHPQKTHVGHKSYLNGWGFCSPWNWRLTPESGGHLKFRKIFIFQPSECSNGPKTCFPWGF